MIALFYKYSFVVLLLNTILYSILYLFVVVSNVIFYFLMRIGLFYINKEINVSVFSKELLLLILFCIPFIYFAMNQEFIFQLYHFIIISIGIYLIFFLYFSNQHLIYIKN